MLSTVLRSKTAVETSIKIMDAFVKMRHYVSNESYSLYNIETKIIEHDNDIKLLQQSFDKLKILNGVTRACEKRPVTSEEIEKLVNGIEAQVYNKSNKEITTLEIGEMVMEGLKELDDVAYVRFASVYRQFKDVNTFIDELQKLIDKK